MYQGVISDRGYGKRNFGKEYNDGELGRQKTGYLERNTILNRKQSSDC